MLAIFLVVRANGHGCVRINVVTSLLSAAVAAFIRQKIVNTRSHGVQRAFRTELWRKRVKDTVLSEIAT